MNAKLPSTLLPLLILLLIITPTTTNAFLTTTRLTPPEHTSKKSKQQSSSSPFSSTRTRDIFTTPTPSSSSSSLSMGLLDPLSNFLQSRSGDFVKLQDTQSAYGPGPALILYDVPTTISAEEFRDMVSDGAPRATRKGVSFSFVTGDNDDADDDEGIMSLSLRDALRRITETGDGAIVDDGVRRSGGGGGCPVLFFSGFEHDEISQCYQIIGQEIYEECGASAACAKAVPNAMEKPLGQVLEEISGDHLDAIGMGDSSA